MSLDDALNRAPPITVRFWGVRGSIACPGPGTARYGGNTPCVEIRCGEHVLILDAGTGIRPLGNMLVQSAIGRNFDILLSHCHTDHIIGLPFFAPLFSRNHVVRIWAGNLQPTCTIESTVRKIMSFPLFPLQVEALQATVEFCDFRAGDQISVRPEVIISTALLNHPGGATGYRIQHSGCSIAYVTDVEIGEGAIDPILLALAKGVDLLILDRLTRTTNYPYTSAGATRAGSRASNWPTRRRSTDYAYSITTRNMTTERWTKLRLRLTP